MFWSIVGAHLFVKIMPLIPFFILGILWFIIPRK